jgi:hypothetical protein
MVTTPNRNSRGSFAMADEQNEFSLTPPIWTIWPLGSDGMICRLEVSDHESAWPFFTSKHFAELFLFKSAEIRDHMQSKEIAALNQFTFCLDTAEGDGFTHIAVDPENVRAILADSPLWAIEHVRRRLEKWRLN